MSASVRIFNLWVMCLLKIVFFAEKGKLESKALLELEF